MEVNTNNPVEALTIETKVVETVKKPVVKATSKVATKVQGIVTDKKVAVKNAVKDSSKKPVTMVDKAKKEVQKAVDIVTDKIEDVTDLTTFNKVIKTGKLTSKILIKAGEVLLDNSLKTSKNIAGVYGKAGKKVMNIGKELYQETSKIMAENKKVMKSTSIKAIKETKNTIKDSHLVDFAFNKN